MKAQNTILAVMLIALMGMLGTACSSDSSPAAAEPATPVAKQYDVYAKMTPDEINEFNASLKQAEAPQAVTLEYVSDLCPGESVESTIIGSRRDADNFRFFRFYATAGETVTIKAERIDCDVDLGMTLWEGTSTTTLRVYWIPSGGFGSNPDLTFIDHEDDNLDAPGACTDCADDPQITFDVEETGYYTVAVYSMATSGTCAANSQEFKITATGFGGGDDCVVDTDGDGVPDDEDDYPESDDRAEVQIDGCDSGVDNIAVGNGAFMMDIINYCAENAGNHGEFVSCVNYYANEWKAAGLISGNQKASIGSCASTSSLP